MIRRPPRSTPSNSSAASDVYKRQILPLEARMIAADNLLIDGALFATWYLDKHTPREHPRIDLTSCCFARTAFPNVVLDIVSDWISETITPWMLPEAYSMSSQFNQTRRLGSLHSGHMFAHAYRPRTCPLTMRTLSFRSHACMAGTHDQYTLTPHRYREISHFDHKSIAAVAHGFAGLVPVFSGTTTRIMNLSLIHI